MNRLINALIFSSVIVMVVTMTVFSAAAQQLNYPQKGRFMTIIVPYNAGGSSDTNARFLAAFLEKKLKATIQVVNKPGAGSQVAMTEFTAAKPDGYALCWGSFAGIVIPYLDPTRQTSYGRKDYKAVAFVVGQPLVLLVAKDGPYKSFKDVITYAKANPEKFKIALSGILLPPHLSVMELEKMAGVKMATVHFDGEAAARTSFLGGHTEGLVCTVSSAISIVQGNQARALGVMDNVVNSYLPDVKTMKEQGFPVMMGTEEALLVPGATPPAIIKFLDESIREVIKDPQFQEKAKQMNIPMRYRNSAEAEEHITSIEKLVKPLVEAIRKSEK
jgi:tripartite-type tricarboxylate transporter receptor subunit TctC